MVLWYWPLVFCVAACVVVLMIADAPRQSKGALKESTMSLPTRRRSDCKITRRAAVVRVAERARRFGETGREARNRVSHRISYAVKRGELVESSRGGFVFGYLAAWARNKWPGKFDDWPCILSVKPANFKIGTSISSVVVLPTSLKGCHDTILAMHAKIVSLRKSNQALQTEIERLRPGAEEWRKLRQRNKENPRKKPVGREKIF